MSLHELDAKGLPTLYTPHCPLHPNPHWRMTILWVPRAPHNPLPLHTRHLNRVLHGTIMVHLQRVHQVQGTVGHFGEVFEALEAGGGLVGSGDGEWVSAGTDYWFVFWRRFASAEEATWPVKESTESDCRFIHYYMYLFYSLHTPTYNQLQIIAFVYQHGRFTISGRISRVCIILSSAGLV